jgi:nitrate/nitrite-specific signal transduction histidine kinase
METRHQKQRTCQVKLAQLLMSFILLIVVFTIFTEIHNIVRPLLTLTGILERRVESEIRSSLRRSPTWLTVIKSNYSELPSLYVNVTNRGENVS